MTHVDNHILRAPNTDSMDLMPMRPGQALFKRMQRTELWYSLMFAVYKVACRLGRPFLQLDASEALMSPIWDPLGPCWLLAP